MFDDIFQFADVARIRILGKRIQGCRFQVDNFLPLRILVLQDEVLDQVRERGLPFTERRKHQVECVQAVIKVFAEGSLLHGFLQVAVGRRKHADIQITRFGLAHAPDFVALQEAQ